MTSDGRLVARLGWLALSLGLFALVLYSFWELAGGNMLPVVIVTIAFWLALALTRSA